MHAASQPRPSGSRFVQSKPAAWAISKPSTNRISSYTKKEIAQLLKASRNYAGQRSQSQSSKFGTARSTDEEERTNEEASVLRRKSGSRILGTLKVH